MDYLLNVQLKYCALYSSFGTKSIIEQNSTNGILKSRYLKTQRQIEHKVQSHVLELVWHEFQHRLVDHSHRVLDIFVVSKVGAGRVAVSAFLAGRHGESNGSDALGLHDRSAPVLRFQVGKLQLDGHAAVL